MPLPVQPLQRAASPDTPNLRTRWSKRPRRAQTVLAPALPALLLLGVVTAGMVDPPQAGLTSQLHISQTASTSTWTVTPR